MPFTCFFKIGVSCVYSVNTRKGGTNWANEEKAEEEEEPLVENDLPAGIHHCHSPVFHTLGIDRMWGKVLVVEAET